MRWLITLETEKNPIVTCRLMNVFRRKGLKIVTLAMTTQPSGHSTIAVVELPEADINHVFNFLRRIEGVRHVACHRHETFENNIREKCRGHEVPFIPPTPK